MTTNLSPHLENIQRMEPGLDLEEEEEEKEEEIEKEREEKKKGSIRMRDTMRDGIKRALDSRMKNVTRGKWAKQIPAENRPGKMAQKIVTELTSLHHDPKWGTINSKCKAKYRSILFNLRDPKNDLFSELLRGYLEPKSLVRMKPADMAGPELRAWRQKETERELKIIEDAEVDTLADKKRLQDAVADRKVDKDEVDPCDAIVITGPDPELENLGDGSPNYWLDDEDRKEMDIITDLFDPQCLLCENCKDETTQTTSTTDVPDPG